MEMNNKVWQITSFTEEINKRFKEKTGTEDGVHYNTVDKWFKNMEAKGIHYILRIGDSKAYDESDIELALYILEKREEKWNLSAIFDSLSEYGNLREFPPDFLNTQVVSDSQLMDEMNRKMQLMRNEMLEEVRTITQMDELEIQKRVVALMPPEKSNEEIAAEQMEQARIGLSIRIKLEDEALDKWNKLPPEERTKKAGLFKREEDLLKRDRFIRDYLKEHLKQ